MYEVPASARPVNPDRHRHVNFAVNNDGGYYPRVGLPRSTRGHPLCKLNDGNYWYHRSPPNRWTFEGSPNATDSVVVELRACAGHPHGQALPPRRRRQGASRRRAFELEYHDGKAWAPVRGAESRSPREAGGRRANVVRFPEVETDQAARHVHAPRRGQTGLTEIEVWGDVELPVAPPPFPTGNLAYNPGDKPFPKASASLHVARTTRSRWPTTAQVNFAPSPHNRWTSYDRRTRPTGWRSTSARRRASAASSWRSTTTAAACRRRHRTASSTGTARTGETWPSREEVAGGPGRRAVQRGALRPGRDGEGARRLHARGQGAQRRQRGAGVAGVSGRSKSKSCGGFQLKSEGERRGVSPPC